MPCTPNTCPSSCRESPYNALPLLAVSAVLDRDGLHMARTACWTATPRKEALCSIVRMQGHRGVLQVPQRCSLSLEVALSSLSELASTPLSCAHVHSARQSASNLGCSAACSTPMIAPAACAAAAAAGTPGRTSTAADGGAVSLNGASTAAPRRPSSALCMPVASSVGRYTPAADAHDACCIGLNGWSSKTPGLPTDAHARGTEGECCDETPGGAQGLVCMQTLTLALQGIHKLRSADNERRPQLMRLARRLRRSSRKLPPLRRLPGRLRSRPFLPRRLEAILSRCCLLCRPLCRAQGQARSKRLQESAAAGH
jgi:hypothetical protein